MHSPFLQWHSLADIHLLLSSVESFACKKHGQKAFFLRLTFLLKRLTFSLSYQLFVLLSVAFSPSDVAFRVKFFVHHFFQLFNFSNIYVFRCLFRLNYLLMLLPKYQLTNTRQRQRQRERESKKKPEREAKNGKKAEHEKNEPEIEM